MFHRYSNSKVNATFGSGTSRSTSPTVISAIQKLKQESQLVLREHKRYRVLNHHISRENIKHLNQSKQDSFYTAVKQSANIDREVTKEYERKKIEEVKKRFSINHKQREVNKQMIQSVKKTFTNVNHETYEQIRQKRKDNEALVSVRRSFVLQSRATSRRKADEEEKSRRKSIQNFYDSRVSIYRQQKEDEVKQLLRKSEQKRRFCDALQNRNSRVRENKLADSRSVRSLRNPEKEEIEA